MTPTDPPFCLVPPQAAPIPVVVEVPHASIAVDAETLSYMVGPARSIGQDADLFVDQLFSDAPTLGATLLVSRRSRYVCDLNRAPTDLDPQTTLEGQLVSAPHGVVWRKTTSGRPALSEPLPAAEIERRLNVLYRPYHQTLEQTLTELEQQFGYVILLCGHSMPSFGRLGERRADIVPGTQGKSTAALELIRRVEQTCQEFSFDFAHDQPYRGGFTTVHHGQPAQNRHAIQIELARRTYMDEQRLSPTADFARVRAFCTRLVEHISQASPEWLR